MQDAISSLLLAICLWQINGRSHPAHESTRRVAPQETQHRRTATHHVPTTPNTPTSQGPHTRNQGQARRANHQPTPAAPGHDPSPTHGNRRPHRPARSSHSRPTPGTRTRCRRGTRGEQSRYVPDGLLGNEASEDHSVSCPQPCTRSFDPAGRWGLSDWEQRDNRPT